MELPNGMVCWTAKLMVEETLIHVVNEGNGGQTKLIGDLQVINQLHAWANKELPDSFEPLQEIIDSADDDQSLKDVVREMNLLKKYME